jgi:peptidoglycan hydrolase-like protein with peptidoglycan-binding domain
LPKETFADLVISRRDRGARMEEPSWPNVRVDRMVDVHRRWVPGGAALVVCGLALALAVAGCGRSSTETTTVTVSAATTTAAPSPPTTAIVIELQQVMTQLGYYTGPIDGVYGQATTAAVKAMQTHLGVTADGIYGPATHNALKGKGSSIVTSLQTALSTYGYYSGPIDGAYGAETTAAVKKLQTDLGVTVDGKFGPETAQAFDQAVADGTIKPA